MISVLKHSLLRTFLPALLLVAVGCNGSTLLDEKDKVEPGLPSVQEVSYDVTNLQAAFMTAAEQVLPTIVTLRIETAGFGTSYGSGVIIDADGIVLTNEHVVEHAEQIEVLLADQRTFLATVRGSDTYMDLAVLNITGASNLPSIRWGTAANLRVGQFVLAFGNAFGISNRDAQPSVTHGIISALHRVSIPLARQRLYREAIQHDAPINPGNSGGPLCDLGGRMIGINGVISSETGNASGVSFAIPVDQIRAVLPDLLAGHPLQHPWLGISRLNNVVQHAGIGSGRRAVEVGMVPEGGPAFAAGMRPGDIIVSVTAPPEALLGEAVEDEVTVVITSQTQMTNWLGTVRVGKPVTIRVFRPESPESARGEFLDLELTVGDLADRPID